MFEQSEVNILGRRYHPNLIELLGYCWEDEKLVLVYEFMHKGSLDNHIFQSEINQATNMFTGKTSNNNQSATSAI